MRKYGVALAFLCAACSSDPDVGEGGEASESSSSTSSNATETGGAEGASGTGETGETDETGETGEPDGMECPSDPSLGFTSLVASLPQGVELPVACELVSEPEPNSNIDLSCEVGGMLEPGVLEFVLGGATLDSNPLQLGQVIEIDEVNGEEGEAWSMIIRDPGTQRLLMASYGGWELDQPLDPQLFAPLSISIADTLCATECENFQGPGVPPDCDCVRKLELEVSAGADPVLIRDRSWSLIEVPGEGEAFFGVRRAVSCEDPNFIEYARFIWLYVAAAE